MGVVNTLSVIKVIILSLLLIIHPVIFADTQDELSLIGQPDTYWDNKIAECVKNYILKQSKSYATITQDNLYNLLNNFKGVVDKLTGNSHNKRDDTSRMYKIELLAQVQCETYYKMGILR